MAVWSMTVKNGIKGKGVLAMSGLVGGAGGSVFIKPLAGILLISDHISHAAVKETGSVHLQDKPGVLIRSVRFQTSAWLLGF